MSHTKYTFKKDSLANDMILFIDNPKYSTKKLLELKNEFSKAVGYKMDIQISVVFYTIIINYQKRKLEK